MAGRKLDRGRIALSAAVTLSLAGCGLGLLAGLALTLASCCGALRA